MKSQLKRQKLVLELNGKYIRMDGFPSDPMSVNRTVNLTKLTDDILEAKDFFFFPQDLDLTHDQFPSSKQFVVSLDVIYEKTEKPM